MKTPLALKPPITEKIIIVDGISRSGKKLVCKIVSHLERVEYFQYLTTIENTAYLYHLGQIDFVNAAKFIQLNTDEAIYNYIIGRHLNTRVDDDSCVFNAPDPNEYVRRSKAAAGRVALDDYVSKGCFPLFHTHSLLAFADLLFESFPNLKLIHVTRHPVDIAEDWLRRGWGERWGMDPIAFNLIANTDNGVVPWFATDWSAQYQSMSVAERCVESVLSLQKADLDRLNALEVGQRKQVYQLAFEKIITSPDNAIDEICEFIGTTPHEKMRSLLVREKCPKPLPVEARLNCLETLKTSSTSDVIERLLQASIKYENEWGIPH